MSLKYLFAQSDCIKTIDFKTGEKINSIIIYPIKIKDYEEFSKCAGVLYLSKKHFDESVQEYSLLELLFLSHRSLGFTTEIFIDSLCKLFSFVTLKDIVFIEQEGFVFFEEEIINDEIIKIKKVISLSNYEEIRQKIMQQNLIYEQKIYKTKLMNEWAQKALIAKQKNASNITLEDIVSTVSVGCGKHYSDLENYTIYQVYSDFYRLRKMIEYESKIQYKCSQNFDASSVNIEDYAENLDLFHNPYDDLFVSSDKLSGLNKAIKQ